jgi:hypothetical protein
MLWANVRYRGEWSPVVARVLSQMNSIHTLPLCITITSAPVRVWFWSSSRLTTVHVCPICITCPGHSRSTKSDTDIRYPLPQSVEPCER